MRSHANICPDQSLDAWTGTDIFDRFAKLERVEVGSSGQAAGGSEGGADRARDGDGADGRKGQQLQQQDAEQEDEDEEQVEEEEQGWDDGDDDYGQVTARLGVPAQLGSLAHVLCNFARAMLHASVVETE